MNAARATRGAVTTAEIAEIAATVAITVANRPHRPSGRIYAQESGRFLRFLFFI